MNLIEAAMYKSQAPSRLAESLKGIRGTIQKERIQELCKSFMVSEDKSPEGLMKIGQALNAKPDEVAAAYKVLGAFQEYKKNYATSQLGNTPISSLKGPDGGINPEATIDQIKSVGPSLIAALTAKEEALPKNPKEAAVRAMLKGEDPSRFTDLAKSFQKPEKMTPQDIAFQQFRKEKPNANSEAIATYLRGLKPPASSVNIDMVGKGLGKLNEELAKSLPEDRKSAEEMANSLLSLQPVKKLLNSPMFTGAGANAFLAIGKGLKLLGVNKYDDPIKNTEAYAAAMAQQVAQIIQKFGAGTGLSDADRDYAEKAAGGKITFNRESLKKIIEMNETAMKNVVNAYNEKARQVMDKEGSEDLLYNLTVKMPDTSGGGLKTADEYLKAKGLQ